MTHVASAALSDLARRLRDASGPDPSLDLDVAIALNVLRNTEHHVPPFDNRREGAFPIGDLADGPPAFTTSVDAAIALAGTVLPDAIWLKKDTRAATIAVPSIDEKGWATHHDAVAWNFATSLTLAVVLAVSAEETRP